MARALLDDDFRRDRERTAPARMVAVKLIGYLGYAPADREPKQITRGTRERAAAYAHGGAVVRFAAA